MKTRARFALCGFAALAVMSALSGCSKGESSDATGTPSYANAKSAATGASVADEAPLHNAARQIGGERSVVREATLDVDVQNLDKAEKQMKDVILSHAGYIDHEEGTGLATDQPVLRLTIRVPEKSFEDVLAGFEGLGHRTAKTISASDLTEQILDVEAQLKHAQQEGGQLTVGNDALQNLRGQRDVLAAKAAMSTIDLTLQQKPSAALSTAANVNWGSDTWNAAMTSALGAFRVIGAIAIWLLAFSPIWGLGLCGPIVGYRLWKRHFSRAQTA